MKSEERLTRIDKIMNKQEILNESYKRLHQQGQSCNDDAGNCYYYKEDSAGNRLGCAIGILLTTEEAKHWHEVGSKYMTVNSLHSELNDALIPDWVKGKDNAIFLNRLQAAHDTLPRIENNIRYWRDELYLSFAKVAHKHDLTLDKIK